MDEKIANFIHKIENQIGRPVLEGDELLEGEDLFFHKTVLTQVLKKYNTSSFSKTFLLAYIKFLRVWNLVDWKDFFEAIAEDEHALKCLLYFSYHYIKVDFFTTFSLNEYLYKFLRAEYHQNPQLYNELDPTIKREFKVIGLNPEDFEYIQEKLVQQGATKVSAKERVVEIITDELLEQLIKEYESQRSNGTSPQMASDK